VEERLQKHQYHRMQTPKEEIQQLDRTTTTTSRPNYQEGQDFQTRTIDKFGNFQNNINGAFYHMAVFPRP
jgi:hypothetical protein